MNLWIQINTRKTKGTSHNLKVKPQLLYSEFWMEQEKNYKKLSLEVLEQDAMPKTSKGIRHLFLLYILWKEIAAASSNPITKYKYEPRLRSRNSHVRVCEVHNKPNRWLSKTTENSQRNYELFNLGCASHFIT